jgi:putative ABC transport system permease protein
MVKNYFKTAWRNLQRNKVYSAINIIGLSFGIAGCLVVANVVIDELSYDTQWKNGNNIYRVNVTDVGTMETIPVALSGLGPALKKNFPEVENYCRASVERKRFSGNGQDKISINCITTEPSFLEMFDFTFLQNSPLTGQSAFNSIIITKEIADKYFHDVNPVGKTIQNLLSNGDVDSIKYIITGVINDIPYNSHLRADAIILKQFDKNSDELSGVGYLYPLYVLLKPGTNSGILSAKVSHWYERTRMLDKMIRETNDENYLISFQPLKDVYLKSDFAKGYQKVIGSVRNVYIFSGVAILLLLIACFNFINLTTARALKRTNEASLRKVLGAGKYHIISQFLFESLIFFIISFGIALFLYTISINPVQAYLGHRLVVSLSQNIKLMGITIFVLLLVCLFTGLYPALALSRAKAALVSGKTRTGKRESGLLRKTLVVGQFAISIIILIAAIVIKDQLLFLDHANVGYDRNDLLKIDYTNWGNSGAAFKREIKNLSGVENASITRWSPGIGGGAMSIEVNNPFVKNKKITTWIIEGDLDFAATLKLQLLQGRFLSESFASDVLDPTGYVRSNNYEKLGEAEVHQSMLLTAYASKVLKSTKLGEPSNQIPGVAVGIVNNFHNESMRSVMKPCAIKANDHITYGTMLIRVHPGAEAHVVKSIGKIWQRYYPSQTLQYDWVNGALKQQYKSEQKAQQLFFFFSALSVFLACLGLFGLANFTTQSRTKEIGIRKVLGASAVIITTMISKDFLKLVFLSILVAAPAALWLMSRWLQDYAYRISLNGWMVMAAAMVAVLIALITISFSTIKAATTNPVKSLRTE